MKPLVSVVLSTHNRGKSGFLTEAIESVLSQTFKNHELIIVDDGSTDNTREICENYSKNVKNITYIYIKHSGIANARNTGIKLSKSDYISFLDDDDLWEPEILKSQYDFITNHPDKNIGMIYNWAYYINDNKEIIGKSNSAFYGDIFYKLLYDNFIRYDGVMLKKSVFEKCGNFSTQITTRVDWLMWLNIARYYTLYPLKKYLTNVRVHSQKRISDLTDINLLNGEKVLQSIFNKYSDKINNKNKYLSYYYFDVCPGLFSLNRMRDFRKYFISGLKLYPYNLKASLIIKYLFSFFNIKLINLIRKYIFFYHRL